MIFDLNTEVVAAAEKTNFIFVFLAGVSEEEETFSKDIHLFEGIIFYLIA